MLRKQPRRAAFFAGSGRLQSELIGLTPSAFTGEQCRFLAAELERHGFVAEADTPPSIDPVVRFCELVSAAHALLLREAGFYFPESVAVADAPAAHAGPAIAIPKIPGGTDYSAELFQRLALRCAETALQATPVEAWIGSIRDEIAKVRKPLLAATHMIRAAYELEMPILEWHATFMQVGYGRNAVALRGSITQDTSSIGVHFAREKSKANTLLARAGFPIAEGGLAKDLADARGRAEALGFPVVVKPADLDGGAAVTTDIRDAAELAQAFEKVRAISRNVMVEKHIHGTDYRMLLFGDELLVTLERTPGGVVGNGADTVARLLDLLNQQPGRGEGPNPLLHEIAFDEEARTMLERQGLTPDSVPEEGRFVPLRRAANHALGGTLRLIDEIHPDNVDLARRAMRLLRLDIAGIDLILPDITRSWREAGGAICEVNAQPFIGEVIGRDYYKEILRQLVPTGGRIPLVLVVGALDPAAIAKLAKPLPGLTVVDADGARRDGRPLSVEGMPWVQACQAALYDRETAAALYILDPAEPIPPVSPADRFSAAFVLDALPAGAEALLRRAEAVYAFEPVKGFKYKAIQRADLAKSLAAALSGKPIPAAARAKPAPRGTAPPARRTRR